jgi:putative RNA 2'-phosphotransferase
MKDQQPRVTHNRSVDYSVDVFLADIVEHLTTGRGKYLMDKRLVQLSRTLAYALRHHPESFGLTLDAEGWVPISELLLALQQRSPWQQVSLEDIAAIMAQSEKQRFELHGTLIRASYGHSVPQRQTRTEVIPPAVLFHGTTPTAAQAIRAEGLKPMQRQYVHLSADEATARAVALRRTPHPVILRIAARQAHEQGISFFSGNDTTWLADHIPAAFLDFPTKEKRAYSSDGAGES